MGRETSRLQYIIKILCQKRNDIMSIFADKNCSEKPSEAHSVICIRNYLIAWTSWNKVLYYFKVHYKLLNSWRSGTGWRYSFKYHPPAWSLTNDIKIQTLLNKLLETWQQSCLSTSLGNLCQCYTIVLIKMIFLLSTVNLPSHSSRSSNWWNNLEPSFL